MHAPACEPLPPIKPFARSLAMAQRRHASSLPEPSAASGSSAPAWQVHQWHQSIRDYSSGSTSDQDGAWRAFEDLCRADDGQSLEVHALLDFASRIAAAATDRPLDSISSKALLDVGARVLEVTRRVSPRLTDDSPPPDRLRNHCLIVSAAAMGDRFDDAANSLYELLGVQVEDAHQYQCVAEMLTVYITALHVHQSAQSVLEFIQQNWTSLLPYLSRPQTLLIPTVAHPNIQKLGRRTADVLVRVEHPTLIFDASDKERNHASWKLFGEYLINVFCQKGEGLVAYDILVAFRSPSVGVSPETVLNVVKTLAKRRAFAQANELFASSSKIMLQDSYFDAYQATGLLLYAHQGDVSRAQEYYGRLAQRQVIRAPHKALMLHAHAISGDVARVTELFHHFFPPVSSSQERPNIYHYTSVILAYAQKGDLPGMNTWLASMSKAGIVPDIKVYNIVLKAFARRGDLSYVADIMDRVGEITFNASLLKELRTVQLLKNLIEQDGPAATHPGRDPLMARIAALRTHRIDGGAALVELGGASKLRTDPPFLLDLYARGHSVADAWLQAHRADLGQRATLDLRRECGLQGCDSL